MNPAASQERLVRSLTKAASEIAAVDAHQHLGAEAPVDTDLCRLMVDDNYLATDLVSSGMTADILKKIADPTLDLMKRWRLLSPFWERVKAGSYARAHLITLAEHYGVRKLRDSAVAEASARLSRDFAAPGLYARVFQERCNVDAVLTQSGDHVIHRTPKFFNVARIADLCNNFSPDSPFDRNAQACGVSVRRLDDFIYAVDAILRHKRKLGAVGFKVYALPWRQPTRRELATAFLACRKARVRSETPADEAVFRLACFFIGRTAALAKEMDVPVAIHTGAPWTNWLDFRQWEPTALIPLLQTFRDTRFDLYHAGLPYGIICSMLGKTFPNVWLNLAWAHVISSELAMRAISEWLDMVPLNKVIAFGGDYGPRTVVLTCGHLAMARRNIVRVLAGRIAERQMTEGEARRILRLWFSENPRELYRLPSRN